MAAIFADSPEGLVRSSGLVAASSDVTLLAMFYFTGLVGAGTFRTLFYNGNDPSTYTQYVWLAEHGNSGGVGVANCLELKISGGSSVFGVNPFNGWHWVAYVRSGSTHRVYLDGALTIETPDDISTETYTHLLLGTDTVAGNWDPFKVSRYREWNAALTVNEIAAEMLSNTPVRTSGLQTDTPLASDRLDDSGNGHDWSDSGGTVTFEAQPLTNSAPGGAINVATLPYSNSQNIHDSGVTNDVWYKRTAPAVGVFGALLYSTDYEPVTDVQHGTSVLDLTSYLSISAVNVPILVPVEAGETYYVRASAVTSTAPGDLDIEFYAAPNLSLEAGGIVVNDDANFMGAILSLTADNEVLAYRPMPPGEAGDILHDSGVMIFEDISTAPDTVKLFDDGFNEIASLAIVTSTFRGSIRANPTLNKFYALSKSPNPDEIKEISPAGTVTATYVLTGIDDVGVIAVGNDGDTLYYWRTADTQKIRRWDLSAGSALSDLVDLGAGGSIAEILIMADGTIMAMFMNFLTNQVIRHYATDGTLLHTYDFSGEADRNFPNGSFWRLARDPNPAFFWFWSKHDVSNPASNGGLSKFRKIRISDGAVVVTRTFIEYETGSYQGDTTAYPFVRFGNSFSCPFFILPAAAGSGSSGASESGSGSFGDELGVIGPLVWVHIPRRVP